MLSSKTNKKILQELSYLHKHPLELIDIVPDDNNFLIWYFLIKCPINTDYSGGFYIGKLIHDSEYPLKPPVFIMLTPTGRFITDTKICITQPYNSLSSLWNIRSFLVGILSMMADDTCIGISHLVQPTHMRKLLAQNSALFNNTHYNHIWIKFTRFVSSAGHPIIDNHISVAPNADVPNDTPNDAPSVAANAVISNDASSVSANAAPFDAPSVAANAVPVIAPSVAANDAPSVAASVAPNADVPNDAPSVAANTVISNDAPSVSANAVVTNDAPSVAANDAPSVAANDATNDAPSVAPSVAIKVNKRGRKPGTKQTKVKPVATKNATKSVRKQKKL
jgi:ubiquitin-conjugating enzyme E2 J2